MKKLLLTAAIAAAAFTIGAAKPAPTPAAPDVSIIYAEPAPIVPDISSIQTRTAVVIAVDYDADVVTMEDAVGFQWKRIGCEDWNIGEVAELLLWDINGTPTILDDVILRAWYSGYVCAFIFRSHRPPSFPASEDTTPVSTGQSGQFPPCVPASAPAQSTDTPFAL